MWNKLMKFVDLGEPTFFLKMYILDALNVNANGTRTLLIKTEKCSNHISAGATERSQAWEKLHAKRKVAWSNEMEGHA